MITISITCSNLLVFVCTLTRIHKVKKRTQYDLALLALPVGEGLRPDDPFDEPLEPLGAGPGPEHPVVVHAPAARVAAAPPAGHERRRRRRRGGGAVAVAAAGGGARRAAEELGVDGVEHGVVPGELPGERRAAAHHGRQVGERERVRVLARRHVPLDVVEVVVGDGLHEPGRVADERLEVALRGGDEVGVVHEQRPGQVVPPPHRVLHEVPRQRHPRRPREELERRGELPLRRRPEDVLLLRPVQPRVHDQRTRPLPPARTTRPRSSG
jgi:hypothetical protein